MNHAAKMNALETLTEVEYLYRDASNYKYWGTFLVRGIIQKSDLRNFLFDSEFFIPFRIGAPGLQPPQRKEDDHELHSFEGFKPLKGKQFDFDRPDLLEKLEFANKNDWFC